MNMIKFLRKRQLIKDLKELSEKKLGEPSKKDFANYVGQKNLTKYLKNKQKRFIWRLNPNIHLDEKLLEECINEGYIKITYGRVEVTSRGEEFIKTSYVLQRILKIILKRALKIFYLVKIGK